MSLVVCVWSLIFGVQEKSNERNCVDLLIVAWPIGGWSLGGKSGTISCFGLMMLCMRIFVPCMQACVVGCVRVGFIFPFLYSVCGVLFMFLRLNCI